MVEYSYDVWGNIRNIFGSMASTLGQDNPIRYRGYYYDNETKLYYVLSRYYSPELCRFINPDSISLVGVSPMTLTDKNLYAYCDNNPVMRKDIEGDIWVTTVLIGLATQYLGDVVGNVLSGKTGTDILRPTSSLGEYVAAGVTALIPGSGLKAAFARNIVTEGIVSVEKHIKKDEVSLEKSIYNVVIGTFVDLSLIHIYLYIIPDE